MEPGGIQTHVSHIIGEIRKMCSELGCCIFPVDPENPLQLYQGCIDHSSVAKTQEFHSLPTGHLHNVCKELSLCPLKFLFISVEPSVIVFQYICDRVHRDAR